MVESKSPEYDFVAEDGFGHLFWVIEDEAVNKRITEIFAEIPALYVADGHHRTAAAALVGEENVKQIQTIRETKSIIFSWLLYFRKSIKNYRL